MINRIGTNSMPVNSLKTKVSFKGNRRDNFNSYKDEVKEFDRYENSSFIDEFEKIDEQRKREERKLFIKVLSGMIALQALLFGAADKYIQREHEAVVRKSKITNKNESGLTDLSEFEIKGKTYTVLGEKDDKISSFSTTENNEAKTYFTMPKEEPVSQKAKIVPEGTLQGSFEGKEGVLEEICAKYDVEPKFIAALIGAETGWGLTGVGTQNNPMSYRASGDLGKDGNGFGIFSTPEAGLEMGISNIASYRERYGIGSIDIDHAVEIGEIYAGNSDWADFVRECYYSIK